MLKSMSTQSKQVPSLAVFSVRTHTVPNVSDYLSRPLDTEKKMPSLIGRLLSVTKVREVTDLINDLGEQHRLSWKPVGDNDNNLAIINLGSDPAAGVVERITNAFDAILEFEWAARGEPSNMMSPRAAVRDWFDIQDGRMTNVTDLRSGAIVALTDRVRVTLRDSERADRPTLDVRDFGIGIRGADFSSSILSLNKSRKLRKLFLAGAFGQGGSTALAYSQYTIIVSRVRNLSPSASGESGPETAAFTIVRFNGGDPRIDKHGLFEYMVDHSTGHPIMFNVSDDDFEAGTLVRHVAMDLAKYKSVMTAPTGSLFYLVHNYLFDPVLPFRVEEGRQNSSFEEKRTAAGNFRLLSKGTNTEYQRSASLTFRDGSVTIKWWVLSADGEDARNRITQYTQPSKPIIVTYNGQKQGDFPNTIIKNDLRLPYLDRYLIVHIDCDGLDNESRRQLFPTTREALRDSAIGDDLRRLVNDTLGGDIELQRLDRERKQRYIRRVDSASVENIRRRLASRVREAILASSGGRGPRTMPPEPRDVPAVRVPIPVQEPPTTLEITSPEPRKVYAGKRFTLRFTSDADPAYFLNPDTFIAVIDPPTFGQYSGTTNVQNGYGTAYFVASEGIEIGANAQITLELRPRRVASLRAQTSIEAVELPTPAGTGDGRIATPNINPTWVTQGEPFWVENNWNLASVAKVVRTEDSVDIFVSADNRRFNSLVARAQRRDATTVDALKDFYLEHISFYSMLAELDSERLVESRSSSGNLPEPQLLEQEMERELARACETICGVAEDMFEVLAGRGAEITSSERENAESSQDGHGVITDDLVRDHS
jgi:hypothetical protein